MADTAAHLVDHVFPEVPVRQWVLSLPFGLRYRLAYGPQMITAVLNVFVRAVFGCLRREAHEWGIEQTQCGAVTFIQRFGGSLNLNIHFHMAAIDGLYAPNEDGSPRFYPLSAPRPAQVALLTETLARRIKALVKRRIPGADDVDAPESDPLWRDDPGLAAIYTASVTNRIAGGTNRGQRVGLAGDRIDPEAMDIHADQLSAAVDAFNLHAGVYVPARDRARLERLLRYAGRPPLATERLEELPDGRVSYRFKTPWRNGTTHAVFSPVELLEKLAALVPSPRAHLVRFHGVFGPAAKWRPLIVPHDAQPAPASGMGDDHTQADQESAPADDATILAPPPKRRRNYAV